MRKRLARLNEEYCQEPVFAPLAATTSLIPGHGSEWYPRVMFVGEAPGAEEEKIGVPFVGQAGQLLRLGMNSIGLDERNCYITNVLKYRPPRNRNPTDEEMGVAGVYLHRELHIVSPDVLVPLGRFALSVWLPGGIMAMQAKPTYTYRTDVTTGRPNSVPVGPVILPLLHPAAVLRGAKSKAAYLRDFHLLGRIAA